MLARISALQGDVGFYYKNLVSGRTIAYQADMPLIAASVIKLPIMVEAYRQFEAGRLDPGKIVPVRAQDKVPSCGVVTYLRDDLEMTVADLVTLSIIVSDNTATNLVIDQVGIDNVNRMLDSLGLTSTRLRRMLFDMESARRGLQNHITAGEIGRLLETLYWGNVVSPDACRRMLSILKDQQLNGKIPFRLPESLPVAHKTGEDDGITHDCGIVYADEPFVLCFCANHVDVPACERLMQDIAWELVYEKR